MNFRKNQNRRDFLLSSLRNGLLSGFGFLGISLHAKDQNRGGEENCPPNILCRDCCRLGVCFEDDAVKWKKEVKTKIYTNKISKGANHG